MRFVSVALCAFAAAQAMAGPREDVLARAAQCATLKDDAAWLACYHAAATAMEIAAPAISPPLPSPAPATAPVNTADTAAIGAVPTAPATGRFGITENSQRDALSASTEKFQSTPQSAAPNHITARVVKYSFSTQKYFTLVLDNGQVWQQINGDDAFVTLQRPATEYQVTIRHGFFGSYNLTITGIPGLFRVRRIS